MAASVSLIVLYPNGRQHIIKASRQTSIWQVLQDACKKQQLNPADYELYHHKDKLNPTLLVSLANLPNNAQLELRQGSSGQRHEEMTAVCLQLESGERLIENFDPTTTLWDILYHWERKVGQTRLRGSAIGEPVCVYMRLEIAGAENLQSTTLESLGLIGGNVVIRLLFRPSEVMGEQAHVSRTYAVPFKAPLSNVDEQCRSTADVHPTGVQVHPPATLQLAGQPDTSQKATVEENVTSTKDQKEEGPMDDSQELVIREDDIKYMGERKGILFDLEHSLPLTFEEPGEEFFQLTLEDAKYLAADYQRQRMLLEERPLETEHLRQMRELQKARAYTSALVRIYFPNRLVLQGTFLPQERVVDIMEFVRGFLQQPNQDFYLYTSPPKTILDPSCTLLNAQLVPAAVVHFGSNWPLPGELFRKQVLAMISTPGGASVAAHRLWSTRNLLDEVDDITPTTAKPTEGKTPKWFTMGKGKK